MIIEETFGLFPIGFIRKIQDSVLVEIREDFERGLLGLEGFSHVILLCWFHGSDTKTKRSTLRVHPRGERSNPLMGVFATRSPRRPNPLALYISKIHAVQRNQILIDPIDAFDDTPVIDIKPYIPESDSFIHAVVPAWVKKGSRGRSIGRATS